MKKYFLIVMLLISILYNNSSANLNNIYNKIDVIYKNSPNNLLVINDKLKEILTKNYNANTKKTVSELKSYIDYKLKNEDFYSQNVSKQTKELIKNINNESYTSQEILEKAERLRNKSDLSLIDKEYVDFTIFDAKVSLFLNHQDFK
jgi:hypothetical protein